MTSINKMSSLFIIQSFMIYYKNFNSFNTFVFILCFCFLGNSNIFAENPDKVLKLLEDNNDIIFYSAKEFNISPRIIASVIYAERTLNVTWMENELDLMLATVGYSSSIGVGQVKIHTAKWIEKKLADSTSKYFLGNAIGKIIKQSKDREEIIDRLEDPQWNIQYVAAYISMFIHRWKEDGFDISGKPEIIGTLYSLGPYKVSDNSERKPHNNPTSNEFGVTTAKFYYSNQLLLAFPLKNNLLLK